MLTDQERENFRLRLLEIREQLMGDAGLMAREALAGDSKDNSGNLSTIPQHMADKGSDTYEQDFTLGRLENHTQVIVDIDEALERVDEGRYGLCEECGGPISPRRLQVKPYARYCVTCKQKLEEEEGLS